MSRLLLCVTLVLVIAAPAHPEHDEMVALRDATPGTKVRIEGPVERDSRTCQLHCVEPEIPRGPGVSTVHSRLP